jgi:hypothetical protein
MLYVPEGVQLGVWCHKITLMCSILRLLKQKSEAIQKFNFQSS